MQFVKVCITDIVDVFVVSTLLVIKYRKGLVLYVKASQSVTRHKAIILHHVNIARYVRVSRTLFFAVVNNRT